MALGVVYYLRLEGNRERKTLKKVLKVHEKNPETGSLKGVLFENSRKSNSAAEYRKETEGKGNHLPMQARAKQREKRTGPQEEDGKRRDEKPEA